MGADPRRTVSQTQRQRPRALHGSGIHSWLTPFPHSVCSGPPNQREVEVGRKPEAKRRKGGEEETCPLILRFSLPAPSCLQGW